MVGKVVEGYVRNGHVVLSEPLPDGTAVEVRVVASPGEFTPEEREEFEAWQAVGAESLRRFEQMMEEEERRGDAPG
jgi:hypothetical protein